MRRSRSRYSAWKKLALFSIGIIVFYASYYIGSRHAPKGPKPLSLTELETPRPIASLALRDQYGNPFDQQRLLDHWNLILFGTTRAVDSVREGLSLVTYVKNRLAGNPDLQKKIRGILITLDPAHDTTEVLLTFMAGFSPDYLALTGTQKAIASAAESIAVTAVDSHLAGTQDHPLNHGGSIALIGPDANVIGLFTGAQDAASIAAEISRLASTEVK